MVGTSEKPEINRISPLKKTAALAVVLTILAAVSLVAYLPREKKILIKTVETPDRYTRVVCIVGEQSLSDANLSEEEVRGMLLNLLDEGAQAIANAVFSEQLEHQKEDAPAVDSVMWKRLCHINPVLVIHEGPNKLNTRKKFFKIIASGLSET